MFCFVSSTVLPSGHTVPFRNGSASPVLNRSTADTCQNSGVSVAVFGKSPPPSCGALQRATIAAVPRLCPPPFVLRAANASSYLLSKYPSGFVFNLITAETAAAAYFALRRSTPSASPLVPAAASARTSRRKGWSRSSTPPCRPTVGARAPARRPVPAAVVPEVEIVPGRQGGGCRRAPRRLGCSRSPPPAGAGPACSTGHASQSFGERGVGAGGWGRGGGGGFLGPNVAVL